jgi:ABC-type transporter Mla maintaining outer membrane lipid asymmetry permease subunit MlaE
MINAAFLLGMAAGRSGSAFTAQIGTMRVTEEIELRQGC